MGLGVAGQGYERPCGHTQREEYLRGRLQPHLRVHQLLPLHMREGERERGREGEREREREGEREREREREREGEGEGGREREGERERERERERKRERERERVYYSSGFSLQIRPF